MGRTVRWVARAFVALAAVVAGPAAARAQDFLLQQDYRVVEGTPTVNVIITRTSSGLDTDVFWRTIDGSAVGGSDFTPVPSGSVHFTPSDFSKTVPVTILNDGTPEPGTGVQDEVFFIELTGVSGAGVIQDGRATVTIVDDDRSTPGAQFLSVVSDGTSISGRNRLQWRVPAGQPNAPTQFHIRWDKGPTDCVFPGNTTAGFGGSGAFTANAAGTVQSYPHSVPVPHEVWCYSIFTLYPAQSPTIVTVKTKTFDSNAGPLKWTYTNTAALPSVAPPTVGQDAIYSVDNDGVLHAMQRSGANAGAWPPTWNPVDLGLPGHNRSPVVPLSVLGWRLFVGTENGEVHSVDGRTGTINWSRSQPFGNSQLMSGSAGTQATPALLLKAYGGLNDLLLVGTATGASNAKFFALDPLTGATIDAYPNGTTDTPPGGRVDNVLGMAVVDYAGNRVYFGTTGTGLTNTLWSLDLGPMGSPDLTLTGALAWNPKPLGTGTGTVGSPVLRNGRLYLDTGSGATSELHSLRISDGYLSSYMHGDGQAKGFAWPDRRNGRLYFSTTSQVRALNDDGSSLAPDPGWLASVGGSVTMTNPSIVLQKPGTDELYVGDGLGRLVRLNAATGLQVGMVTLDANAIIGAPSLDNVNNMLLVGSDKGVIYAVQVGF